MKEIINKLLDRITIEDMEELYDIELKHLRKYQDYETKIGELYDEISSLLDRIRDN